MRKFLPVVLAATVYLIPLYPVYAQNGATPSDQAMNAPLYKTGTASAPANIVRPKAKALAAKDKVASSAALIKGKLAKFKDKSKAARVENIINNLNNINKRWTNAKSQSLAKMSEILSKLKTIAEDRASAGKDVTGLNTAITEAQIQWAEANAALTTQMGTEYLIVINKESTVKEDAAIARNNLHTGLQSVQTQIVEARQALSKAIRTAVSSQGGNNGSQ